MRIKVISMWCVFGNNCSLKCCFWLFLLKKIFCYVIKMLNRDFFLNINKFLFLVSWVDREYLMY